MSRAQFFFRAGHHTPQLLWLILESFLDEEEVSPRENKSVARSTPHQILEVQISDDMTSVEHLVSGGINI